MKKIIYSLALLIIFIIGVYAHTLPALAVEENALANCCVFYYADTFDQYVPETCKAITNEQACSKYRSNSDPASDDVKCCLYTLWVGLPSPKCQEDFLNYRMEWKEVEKKCADSIASWDEKFAKTFLGPVSTDENTAELQQDLPNKQNPNNASKEMPVENQSNNNIIIILAGAIVLLLIILSFAIGFIMAKNKKKDGISGQ